jgi:hypothetical protein
MQWIAFHRVPTPRAGLLPPSVSREKARERLAAFIEGPLRAWRFSSLESLSVPGGPGDACSPCR